MIGNDIIDLAFAKKESNWRRKGFLDKIFSSKEQSWILESSDPELMVWNLWSRKESAYKIYNRQTGIRGYFPLRLQCDFESDNSEIVKIDEFIYYTQTEISDDYIYSVSVSEIDFFKKITHFETLEDIKKENGIPYLLDSVSKRKIPVSITHHGRFQRMIKLP